MGNWEGPGRDVAVDLGPGFRALSLPATLSSEPALASPIHIRSDLSLRVVV